MYTYRGTVITGYTKCECGAVTLFTESGNYCCKRSRLKSLLPGIDLRKIEKLHEDTAYCDHCVNRYGIDLCACGSGEPYRSCKGGYTCCGKPMQIFGGRDCYHATGSWLAGGRHGRD